MTIRISRRTAIIALVLVVVLALAWRLSVGRPQPGTALASASPTATPTTRPALATASPSPTAGPSPTAVASPVACIPTDQDRYVYHPARLKIVAACVRVTGVVAEVRTEADGDLHILLDLDAAFAHLLTPANQGVERGDLVVEPICVGSVSQADAIGACDADPDPMTSLPRVGDYVWMEGRYVLDLEHNSWAELHPLYRWGLQPGTPLSAPSNTPIGTPAAGCDPAYPTVCIPPPPPDLDCGDIPYRRFTVLAPDPHHFDGDHDGIGCES